MSAKTDVIVKMASVFFLALFSFAVGTFVGKKYSDNQHQLAAMEPSGSKSHGETQGDAHGGGEHSAAAESHDSGQGGESAKEMTDEEVAKLGAETMDDEKPAAAGAHGDAHAAKADEHAVANAGHGDAHSAKADEHAASAHEDKSETNHGDSKAAAHEPAKPMVASTAKTDEHGDSHGDNHAVKPIEKPAAKPAAKMANKNESHDNQDTHAAKPAAHGAPADSNNKAAADAGHGDREPASLSKDAIGDIVGKFTVQVGAYPNMDEAKKMVEMLNHDGFAALYTPAEVRGKTWYRVGIGPFATESEAKKEQEKIKGNSRYPASFVKKISR